MTLPRELADFEKFYKAIENMSAEQRERLLNAINNCMTEGNEPYTAQQLSILNFAYTTLYDIGGSGVGLDAETVAE